MKPALRLQVCWGPHGVLAPNPQRVTPVSAEEKPGSGVAGAESWAVRARPWPVSAPGHVCFGRSHWTGPGDREHLRRGQAARRGAEALPSCARWCRSTGPWQLSGWPGGDGSRLPLCTCPGTNEAGRRSECLRTFCCLLGCSRLWERLSYSYRRENRTRAPRVPSGVRSLFRFLF